MAERKVSAGTVMVAAAGDAQKLHASAGRAMQNGHRTQGAGNNDAISRESALQLALGNLGAPLGAAVAHAVLIGVLDQKRRARLIVAENEVPVLGGASAVGVIVGGRRFAVVPEDFARGCVGDAAQMGINAGDAQVLAMRGVAEVESFQGVAAAKVHRVGARRNRHGLQRLIGLEVSCFAGEHARDVFLHRHERGDEQVTVTGANLNRKISAQAVDRQWRSFDTRHSREARRRRICFLRSQSSSLWRAQRRW